MAEEIKDVVVTDSDLAKSGLPATMKMSPGLAIFFNDVMYSRVKQIAALMAGAEGVIGKHLIGCPQACFSIVSRAIVWNLDPFSVAQATYQTPGGSIGYEGKLIQAVLEQSGRLVGGVDYELVGDWDKVKGKFTIKESPRGGKYPVPSWGPAEAVGLSVIVSAQVKDEASPRSLKFELIEAFPLNSPLWATAPHRQIRYTAVRAFANLVVPSLLMGVPFDVDPTGFYGTPLTDVTPAKETGTTMTPARPTASAFERKAEATDVHPEPMQTASATAASVEVRETDPEPAAPEEGQKQEAQPEPEPVAVQAEIKPAEKQTEPEVQKEPEPAVDHFGNAEKKLKAYIASIVESEDLVDFKSRGTMAIDAQPGLTDEDRTVLRGQLSQAVLETTRARAKAAPKAKKGKS